MLLKTVRASLKLQRLGPQTGTNGVANKMYLHNISELWAMWLAKADGLTAGMIFKIFDTDQSGQTVNQPKWSLIQTRYFSSPVKYQTCSTDWADLKRETNTRLCWSKTRLLWMPRWGTSPPLLSQRSQRVPRRRHWWTEEGKEVEEEEVRGGWR